MKTVTFLRTTNNIEDQRRMYRSIRHIENKVKGGSTSKITTLSSAGNVIELTSKIDIEKIISDENEKKYHQTKGGSQLCLQEFINDLGHYGDGPKMMDLMAGTYVSPEWASTDTRDFIAACHINAQAASLSKNPDIITRFK